MSVGAAPFGPIPQFELATGLPAVGNQLFFYVAGSVNTKQDTFTSSTGLVANTNPIILNSLGMPANAAQIWFTSGLPYKVVYAPAGDTDPPTSPIWSVDGLIGIDPSTSAAQDQWVPWPVAPTYIGATSFTLPGDQSAIFHVGRRVKTVNSGGTIYSTISGSVFGALTTVTVINDSGVLDAGLSAVSYGIISFVNTSDPYSFITPGTPINGAVITNSSVSGSLTFLPGSEIFLSATAAASLGLGLGLSNGYITASAAANALTIAIKAVGANDPSATDPVTVVLRNPTASDGTYTGYAITGALSLVFSSGSTMGCANSETVRIHIGIMRNASTGVELFAWTAAVGASSSIYCPETGGFVTTTAEGGAGGADSSQTPYSTTARAAQPWRYLGYIEATSGATAGQWASVSKIVNWQTGVPLPGAVVNQLWSQTGAVATGTTIIPADDTIPQITEGTQFLSISITAQSALNFVDIECTMFLAPSAAVGTYGALFQVGISNALAAGTENADVPISAANSYLRRRQQIGTAAAVTFTARGGPASAATVTFNGGGGSRVFGGVMGSYISVTERQA